MSKSKYNGVNPVVRSINLATRLYFLHIDERALYKNMVSIVQDYIFYTKLHHLKSWNGKMWALLVCNVGSPRSWNKLSLQRQRQSIHNYHHLTTWPIQSAIFSVRHILPSNKWLKACHPLTAWIPPFPILSSSPTVLVHQSLTHHHLFINMLCDPLLQWWHLWHPTWVKNAGRHWMALAAKASSNNHGQSGMKRLLKKIASIASFR